MGKEIEKKFLLEAGTSIPIPVKYSKVKIKQGYIFSEINKQVRIRLTKGVAIIAVKFGDGLIRDEFEYVIPYKDGKKIYSKCVDKLEKKRLSFKCKNIHYDIDCYPNELIVVEVEFKSEKQMNRWIKPSWIGEEVSGRAEFSNSLLAKQNLMFKKKPLL